MDEIELEHRLTDMEARIKSNMHRLEKLEQIVDEIHIMSKTMVELVQEVKHTNEAVNSLDEKVARMDSRVDEMEKRPGKEIFEVKKTLSVKILGILVDFFMIGLIWAALQAS